MTSYALVAGAFKPPHLGHVAMVNHYLKYADEVKVIISDPKSEKTQRYIGSKAITAQDSKACWDLMLDSKYVTVVVSNLPSPVSVVYDSVMPDTTPFVSGDEVYVGVSSKGNDAKRYARIQGKAASGVIVKDPVKYASPAVRLPEAFAKLVKKCPYYANIPSIKKGIDIMEYSASDLRFFIEISDKCAIAKKCIGFYVGKSNVEKYIQILKGT